MLLLKSKNPEYFSYQGRKVSKKIPLSKRILLNKYYNEYSLDELIIKSIRENVNQQIVFPSNYKKVNIEIGFGNGEFLIKKAISNPNELFIGVEVYLNGIVKVLTTILDFKLKNILLSNMNSFFFLKSAPNKSVDKIYIINPDPWIKKRHNKRRLMTYQSIKNLNRVIKTKNSIHMTTDSKPYLNDTINLLDKHPASLGSYSMRVISKNDELYGISRYQRKAIENGGKIYLLTL